MAGKKKPDTRVPSPLVDAEYLYIDDVVDAMKSSSNKVASNVNAKNIQDGVTAQEQFSKLGSLFTEWGKIFSRNAMQAASFSYQHASIYEANVDSAIGSEVKGAVEIKEKLEGKRKKRNAASAATRQANLARLNEEKKKAKGV
jgi:uncharacterized protein YycO